MKIELIRDIPVDPAQGLKKGQQHEVLRPHDPETERLPGVWIQGKTAPVKILRYEYKIITEEPEPLFSKPIVWVEAEEDLPEDVRQALFLKGGKSI